METTTKVSPMAWNQADSRSYYRKQVWAIGGGKGGVGKSLISSSLAYTLAKQGHSVLILDLDLGGANLHTVLGEPPPQRCISDVLNGTVGNLSDCIVQTQYPNLKLIAGAKDDLNITQVQENRKHQLLRQIHQLDAQFILLDLGAGTNQYTLEFFNLAEVGLVTVLPEPTSIENAYRFLKASYYQRLHRDSRLDAIRPLIEAAMTPNNSLGIQSPTHLMNEVRFQHPELSAELKTIVSEFQPKVILNQVRSQSDIDVGFSMKSVTKRYFGIELDYLGYLEYEPNVWQSVRRMRPILAEYPHSRLALHVERICNYLLKQAKIEQTLYEPK